MLKNRQLNGFERLETRTMLAGNVAASVSAAGDLVITGDRASNDIIVTDLGGGTFRVSSGVDTTGINGGGGPDILGGVTRDIFVRMRRGDDSIDINGDFAGSNLRDIRVQTGRGKDSVTVRDFTDIDGNISVRTKRGSDNVLIDNNDVGASIEARHGRGTDAVAFFDNDIDQGLKVRTGKGADLLVADDNLVSSNTDIFTGAGPDEVALVSNTFDGVFGLRAARAADQVFIGDDDSFGGDGNTFNSEVGIRSGKGRDDITLDGDSDGGTDSENDFNGDTTIRLSRAKDTLFIADSDFAGALRARFFGGRGVNALVDGGNNTFAPGQPEIRNFV